MPSKLEFWIAKDTLDELRAGFTRQVTLYKESELHHAFGDHPEESAVKIEIVESAG